MLKEYISTENKLGFDQSIFNSVKIQLKFYLKGLMSIWM